MDSSAMQHYMSDAKLMFKQYVFLSVSIPCSADATARSCVATVSMLLIFSRFVCSSLQLQFDAALPNAYAVVAVRH